jgi:hypothetical protein
MDWGLTNSWLNSPTADQLAGAPAPTRPKKGTKVYSKEDDALQAALPALDAFRAQQAQTPMSVTPGQPTSITPNTIVGAPDPGAQRPLAPDTPPVDPTTQLPHTFTPDAPTMVPSGGNVQMPAPSGAGLPSIMHPSFSQAMTNPDTGGPGPINSSETKLGKLLHFLTVAGQGAAVGSQYNNFGRGFSAETQFQDQQTKDAQQQQAGQLALQERKAQLALLPWQTQWYKQQQALAAAHTQQQINESKSRQNYLDAGADKRNTRPLAQQYADAVSEAQGAGRDPSTDPLVQSLGDAITGIQRPGAAARTAAATPHTVTVGNKVMQFNPETNRYDIDVGPIAQKVGANARDPNRATQDKFVAMTTEKNNAQTALHKYHLQADGTYLHEDGKRTLTADEYAQHEQEIQDNFESAVKSGGGEVGHIDYKAARSGTQPAAAAPALPDIPTPLVNGTAADAARFAAGLPGDTASPAAKAASVGPVFPPTAPAGAKYKVGDSVMYKGKPHKVVGYDRAGNPQISPL